MKKRVSIAFGFIFVIVIGAILLATPWARNDGVWGLVMPSLFTACSAVCVTGLTVVDVAKEFSFAGQIVLLVLVEVGCLGLMTVGTFLMIAIGRRLSLSREFSLMNAYGVEQVQGLKGLICWVVGSMIVIEVLGAAALYYHFHDVYLSIYYSVMSFCNAGFSLLPNSLSTFANDPYMLLVLATETILGGIGFLVIYNLCTFKFSRRSSGGRGRLSLHTKVVLRVSVILLLISSLAFFIFEYKSSLSGYGFYQKLWVSFYQAVTPRTCGFCVIATESLQPITRHIYEILMFIGGAPGSAAAGMKVTTLAVLIYTTGALCRGERDTIIGNRVVPWDTVRESIVIFLALSLFTVFIMGALLVTEAGNNISSEALLFEAISAVTTTGLSMGATTASLSPLGKVIIMIAMFLGRLGALTVVMMIGDREHIRRIGFPNEELVVG